MARYKLINRDHQIITTDLFLPDVKVSYRERIPHFTLVEKVLGNLSYDIQHTNLNQVIEQEYTVKRVKLDKSGAKDELVRLLMRQTDEVSRIIKIGCPSAPEIMLLDLEERLYRATAYVTELPAVFERYKENSRQRAESAHQETNRRKEEQAQQLDKHLHDTIIDIEARARYDITMAVTTGLHLDYCLPWENIVCQVRSLFLDDDNLLGMPTFKPARNGEWVTFVKGIVGEGFYNRLRNIQDDLDEFYMGIADAIKGMVSADEKVTSAHFEEAIREFNTKEYVLELFTREEQANVELLKRLNLKLCEGLIDGEKWNASMNSYFSAKGGLYVVTSNDVLWFNVPSEYRPTTEQEVAAAVGLVEKSLRDYIRENEEVLRFPLSEVINGSSNIVHEVMVRKDLNQIVTVGSYGTLQINSTSRSARYWDDFKREIEFKNTTGKSVKTPYKYIIESQNAIGQLQIVGSLGMAFGDANCGIKALLAVNHRAVESARKQELEGIQQKIRGYHPYIEQEMTFIPAFWKGMKDRIERIYAA